MSEIVEKKISMKIFDTPLTGSEMKGYAMTKDIRLSGSTKNKFLLGEIFVDNQIYGLLGLEKEYWTDTTADSAGMSFLDRVMVSLYDTRGREIGQIEERLLKELAQSTAGGKLPVFTISLRNQPYMVDIEKESGKYVLPLLIDKSKGYFEIFQIVKKGLAIGADFTVTRKLGEEKVAFINSKRGGKVEIEIYNEELAKNKDFTNLLALFAGTIQYHDSISEKIENAIKAMTEGLLILKPSKKSLQLLEDPRKTKRSSEKTTKKKTPTKEERKGRRIRGKDEEEEEAPKRKRRVKKKSDKEDEEPKKTKTFKPLYLDDAVNKVTGVNKATAELLEEIGVLTVEHLLNIDPIELQEELDVSSITKTKIKRWQTDSKKRIKETLKMEAEIEEDTADYDLLDMDL